MAFPNYLVETKKNKMDNSFWEGCKPLNRPDDVAINRSGQRAEGGDGNFWSKGLVAKYTFMNY